MAYVLPKKNALVPTARELQKHLLRSLPDYMIPAIFVRLHALPLSPNGKLDLTMLAQPTDANLLETTAAKAPATPIEEKLLTIVRELLENDAVVAADNFFLAGGHSLLGMQLVMRVQKAFGVDLTLRQLFEAPTVERLALLVETMLKEARLAVIWADLLGEIRRIGRQLLRPGRPPCADCCSTAAHCHRVRPAHPDCGTVSQPHRSPAGTAHAETREG